MNEYDEVEVKPAPSPRSDKCRRCNRVLKTPESIEIGYGPTCYKKFLGTKHLKKLVHIEHQLDMKEELK